MSTSAGPHPNRFRGACVGQRPADPGLEALARRAVAFATAKLGRIGPHLPSPDDVRQLARRVDVAVLAS